MADDAHTTPVSTKLAGSTRRALLTNAATVAACAGLQVAAVAGEHPDATLIAIRAEAVLLLAEHDQHVAAFFALPKGHPNGERVGQLADPAFERLGELVIEASALQARTVEGYAAKALLLRHLLRMDYGNGLEFDAEDATDLPWLAWTLVEDLAGSAVA